jgi:hypothetical protein
LACGFFIFPAFFGVRSDPKTEEFLKSAGVVEKFGKAQAQQSSKGDVQSTPLVTNAQAFGLYLNPPKPVPKPEDAGESVLEEIKPALSAKFTLIGTSFSAVRPELSKALIDEPGKGMYWVKQSSKIGHLVIEQIKDGIVIVSDGGRSFELVAERPEKISFLKNPPPPKPALLPAAAQPPAPPDQPPASPDQPPASPDQPPPTSPVQMGKEEETGFEKFTLEIQAVEADVQAGKLDPNVGTEKIEALMEKHMSETETIRARVSAEEAQDLDRLGQQLQAKKDVNSVQPSLPRPVEVKQTTPAKVESKPQTKTASSSSRASRSVPRQRDPRRRVIKVTGSTDANSR